MVCMATFVCDRLYVCVVFVCVCLNVAIDLMCKCTVFVSVGQLYYCTQLGVFDISLLQRIGPLLAKQQ